MLSNDGAALARPRTPSPPPFGGDGADALVKVLCVGESGVGKTSLVRRFCVDEFVPSDTLSTIGVDFKLRTLDDVDGRSVKVQLWDTAGLERFRTMTSSYYRGAHAVLLIFDITEALSFASLRGWMREARRYCTPSVRVFVIGNKCDLAERRAVDRESVQEFMFKESVGEVHDLTYYETSARTSSGVVDAFVAVARSVLLSPLSSPHASSSSSSSSSVSLNSRSVDVASSDSSRRCAC